MGADAEWERFDQAVAQTCTLLAQYHEDNWVRWLEQRAERFRAEGPWGASRFLQGWAGMGGFIDLVICPANGHDVPAEDVARVNSELVTRIDAVAASAKRLRIAT